MEIDVVNQNFSGNAQVIYLPRKYFLWVSWEKIMEIYNIIYNN